MSGTKRWPNNYEMEDLALHKDSTEGVACNPRKSPVVLEKITRSYHPPSVLVCLEGISDP